MSIEIQSLAAESEARFSLPTSICPSPQNWTSTDSDSTEREVADMIYGLIRGLQPEFCVETGTASGEVTLRIGQALLDNGHGSLVTLETDPEQIKQATQRLGSLLDPEAGVVRLLQMDSLVWRPGTNAVIDFAYFDSFYDWLIRIDEFDRYRPWMRAGTIVCFHDTVSQGQGQWVEGSDYRSILSARLRKQMRFIHLPTPRGITLGEVLP